jgi:hypothetical protein
MDSDHGLLRLMCFHELDSAAPLEFLFNLRCTGARWGAQLSADLFNSYNHAVDAKADGFAVNYHEPQRAVVYSSLAEGERLQPFVSTIACVREFLLLQPHAIQNIYQRYDYDIPNYGNIDFQSKFKTSQFTHCGLTVIGEHEMLDFYSDTLGKVGCGVGPQC